MRAPIRVGVAGVAAAVAIVALGLVIVNVRPEIESGDGSWPKRRTSVNDQGGGSGSAASSLEDRVPEDAQDAGEGIVELQANTADEEETPFRESVRRPEPVHPDSSLRPWESSTKDDLERRLNAIEGWDEFYLAAKPRRPPQRVFRDMVIDRVARELELDEEKAEELRNLIKTEQVNVTGEALDRFGDRNSMRRRVANGDEVFWNELRELRRDIRGDYESQYLNVFVEAEMEVIDSHLRNKELRLYSRGREFLVGGVGIFRNENE